MFVIIIVYIYYIRFNFVLNFLCSVGVIHLYSNNISIIATISSLIISEFLTARFSCINNFILIHNSFGFSEGKIVFNPDASIAL